MKTRHLLVLLPLLLTGCASLRVDVDVYKGPLINEPDVQLQQVAAQAIASRTLIQTLITDTKSGGYGAGKFSAYAAELRSSLWALADMIEMEPQVAPIVDKLAAEAQGITDSTKLAECIVQARAEISRLSSSPHIQARMDTVKAQLLTEASPNVAEAKRQITQFAQDARQSGITQQLALLKSTPSNEATKPDLRKRLIEFAERARWMGNHTKLFLKLLDDEIALQAAPYSPSPIDEESRKLRKSVETHSLILQSIGNAILSQTNEIERMAGLNDKDRSGRLIDRERAVWGSVGLTRVNILASLSARADGDWSLETGELSKLKVALTKAKTESDNAAVILDKAVTSLQGKTQSLVVIQTTIGKLAEGTCKSDKTKVGELLDACLDKDSTQFKSGLIGKDLAFDNDSTETTKDQLHKKAQEWLTQLRKWHADAALFRVWKAYLANEEKLLAGLDQVKTANPRETVDLAISRLRGQQVEAALAGDTERRGRIESAIQLLLSHRAGMVPLVPSASYLRNSMPATSLSEGIKEKDEANMLWQAFIRAFPDTKANGEEQMRLDLDKQYWQPVNRVRVSGSGDINQVLAKDDVGNWYVKSFDTDKTVIFESMKKLALYNLAGDNPALGALRTRLANTKGLAADQLKMSDLGIGSVPPAATAPVENDLLVPAKTASADTQAAPSNGTAADVYKVALTRYGKALQATYVSLQCDKALGTENTDVCASGTGTLTTKAQEDMGKMDLKALDEAVATLLEKQVEECTPDVASKSCKGATQAAAVATPASPPQLNEAELQDAGLDELKLSADKTWSVASMTLSDLKVSQLHVTPTSAPAAAAAPVTAPVTAPAATPATSVAMITGGKITTAKIGSIKLTTGAKLYADQGTLTAGKAGGVNVPTGTYTHIELGAKAGQDGPLLQGDVQLSDAVIVKATSEAKNGKVEWKDAVLKGGTLGESVFGTVLFTGTQGDPAPTSNGDAARFKKLTSLLEAQSKALARFKSDMETISESIGKPLQ